MAVDLSVDFCGVRLKNPVMTASGTFGYGREYAEFFDLSLLGAVMVKGVSTEPWLGNPLPRIAETPGGMLNAIGLQNPGVDSFIEQDLPFLRQFDTCVIVNIIGRTVEEYAEVARRLDGAEGVHAIEINISCPNIKEGGISFGADPDMAARVVEAVRNATKKPIIPKLSPNVTSPAVMAKACQNAGADGLSAINTLLGMAIDVETQRPVLANTVGGLSGPAIKPVALRIVWEVYQAVDIPIVGMGGITVAEDAVEFALAGASAIAVGTANFINPRASLEIIEGIRSYMERKKAATFTDIVGKAHG